MGKLAPVVLFTYNRPDHTLKTVEALKNNLFSNDTDLIIYSDAPKQDSHHKNVEAVRELIRNIEGFKSLTVVEKSVNQGLANSIISGVTKTVNKYGRVIVLEDDIVTSPYFLKYMNDALDFYENNNQVMHISSYNFPIKVKKINETFLMPPTTCWGWATWENSWSFFRKNPEELLEKFSVKDIYDFNLQDNFPYWSHVQQNLSGEIDTWAIFWYASVFLQNGQSLHPVIPLSKNIGNDGTGTNCGKDNIYDVELSPYSDWIFEKSPYSENYLKLVMKHLRKQSSESFMSVFKKYIPDKIWQLLKVIALRS